MAKLSRVYRFLVYMLPAVVFFSYYPVISLGSNNTMNFDFSLPLVWLVVFGVVALIMMAQRKILFRNFGRKWVWLLFPIFLTLSVLWSMNFLRGVLTVGMLWLVYFAGYAFWNLRSLFSEFGFKEKFWKVFFASSLVICGWCLLQCIFDLVGASREVSLMCAGCTYEMFGFPHPNGFAIEPQFMGNLLLAPAIISTWFALRKNKKYFWLFFIFAAAIFLTFSRGAIYAFIVAMIFMVVMEGVRQKSWKICKILLFVAAAFLFTLNLQGIMAQVSPTNDTYVTGIAKVLNHLSLGVIDVRSQNEEVLPEETEAPALEEKDDGNDEVGKEAVFDGYVAESTDTRMWLTGVAVEVWKKDLKTVMFGVGLGGAGQALYVNGLSPAPKEIVQNEYASLLLETGLIGVALLILTIVLMMRVILKNTEASILLTLAVAYGITLLFFSGLPNALHIYLLPALFWTFFSKEKSDKKKLARKTK